MNPIVVALLSVAALSILIIVHELGHFFVAKKMGIWVEEFGIGLPPRIFGKKIGETIFSINAIPLGGFVRLHGETNESEVTDTGRAFVNKSFLPRILVILAGVVMNFVFGVACFALVYSVLGIPRETQNVKIVEVATGSPAQISGLLVGDIVRNVDKKVVVSSEEFIKAVEEKKGKKIVLEIEREVDGKPATQKITTAPRETPPENEGPLGVAISTTEIYFPPIWQRPFVGAYYGLGQAIELGKVIVLGLGGIAKDASQGKLSAGLVGPVGLVALLAFFVKTGVMPLVNFLGLISINFAILNIVPFPPLDGSRILTIVMEKLMGKKIVPKVESIMHTVGMILLLALTLLITIREIPKLITAGTLTGFVEQLIK